MPAYHLGIFSSLLHSTSPTLCNVNVRLQCDTVAARHNVTLILHQLYFLPSPLEILEWDNKLCNCFFASVFSCYPGVPWFRALLSIALFSMTKGWLFRDWYHTTSYLLHPYWCSSLGWRMPIIFSLGNRYHPREPPQRFPVYHLGHFIFIMVALDRYQPSFVPIGCEAALHHNVTSSVNTNDGYIKLSIDRSISRMGATQSSRQQ